MNLFKKTIPITVCFLMGVLCLIQFYSPHRVSIRFADVMSDHMNIIAYFAYMLGIISLVMGNFRAIKRRVDGWGYNVLVFIGIAIGLVTGIASRGQVTGPGGMTSFGWMYNYMYSPMLGTMFSILAFYLVSCSYRAFRVKSKEAGVLFITAALFIFGRVPLGQYLWDVGMSWTGTSISAITEWLMNYPAVAARRAIMIGVALGAIATSVKIIIGIERQYLGGKE